MRGTEFAELSAFVAVAERKNFAKACAYLGIAPSTLSQTIRSLEDRLGVRLLHRTTRSVSITEAGERLLTRIRPAFDELDAAVDSIGYFRNTPTGTLRLSVSTIPAQMILAPLLKDFLAAYPAINMDITVDNTSSDIVSGRFDAGIRYGRRIEQDMLLIKASHESRIIAVASPEYLAAHPVPKTPEDLQQHACVRFRLNTQAMLPWEFEKNKKKIEVAVNGPLIVNDADLMLKAARDGIGVGYMVEAYAAADIREGRLIPMLVDWSPAHHSYYLYYASRRQLPVPLKVFIEFLRQSLRD
jgi:DNA-binding transcriptional LysR family regulator